MQKVVAVEPVEKSIFIIRGQKVMLSAHLSKLYGVEVRTLIQAIKRNVERFPADFMFQLTWEETESLRSQFVILNNYEKKTKDKASRRGRHVKYTPYAFTEQGVAMLSTVLRSKKELFKLIL